MTMVAMVLAVAHTPSVVWHQNGGVCDVANKIIEVAAVAEALVTTVEQMYTHKAATEHIASSPC